MLYWMSHVKKNLIEMVDKAKWTQERYENVVMKAYPCMWPIYGEHLQSPQNIIVVVHIVARINLISCVDHTSVI